MSEPSNLPQPRVSIPRMVTRRKPWVFGLVTLLLAYALLELSALAAHSVLWHAPFLFEQHREARAALLQTRSADRSREFGTIVAGERGTGGDYYDEVLHPYLGFVRDPSVTPGYSPFGFPDEDVQVYKPDPNRVIIGIFGGSFADGVAKFTEDVLVSELQRSAPFAGKEVKILDFAMAGYKQPQQLLTLAYMLTMGSHFDVAVNLDGFNEVALSTAENLPKGVSPFYPRNWFGRIGRYGGTMLAFKEQHEALAAQRRFWAARLGGSWLRFSVTANVLWKAYDRATVQRMSSAEVAALRYSVPEHESQIGYAVSGPKFSYRDEDDLYEILADHWRTASVQMSRLAAANDITYLHFLQPNQYLAGSKPLHPKELETAYTPEHPYSRGVRLGYPKLIRRGRELTQEGVAFHDMTMILAEHPEPLYADSCCHLGREGQEIIARFMADRIAKVHASRLARLHTQAPTKG